MKLKNFTIELGYKCNSDCDYCFQKQYKIKNTELADKDIINLFINIKTQNLLENKITIMFFGGESLIYLKKIKEILNELSKNQIEVQPLITTNGILLTDNIINELIELNIYPTISLDGAPLTQLTHRKNGNVSNKEYYTQIKKYVNKCKLKKIPTLCQSTITPMTIGKLTETFLTVSQLGFDAWWYELEQLSDLGHNQWNNIVLNHYRKQIKQILELEKISNTEILPKTCIINYLNNIKDERINLYINAKGDIHFSTRLINRLNSNTAQYFDLFNIKNFDIENLKKKIDYILPFSYRTTYVYHKDCDKCLMNKFCILEDIPKPLQEIQQLQDNTNCAFWKILSEEMEEVNCFHTE